MNLTSSLSELLLPRTYQCTHTKCLYLSFQVWLFQICLAPIVGAWGCLWFIHGGHTPSVDTESDICLSYWPTGFTLLVHSTPCGEIQPLLPHSKNSIARHNFTVMQTTAKRSHALQQTVSQDTSRYCMQKWCPRTSAGFLTSKPTVFLLCLFLL